MTKRNADGGYVAPEPGGYQKGNPVMGVGIKPMVKGERSWPLCGHNFVGGYNTWRCSRCGVLKEQVRGTVNDAR